MAKLTRTCLSTNRGRVSVPRLQASLAAARTGILDLLTKQMRPGMSEVESAGVRDVIAMTIESIHIFKRCLAKERRRMIEAGRPWVEPAPVTPRQVCIISDDDDMPPIWSTVLPAPTRKLLGVVIQNKLATPAAGPTPPTQAHDVHSQDTPKSIPIGKRSLDDDNAAYTSTKPVKKRKLSATSKAKRFTSPAGNSALETVRSRGVSARSMTPARFYASSATTVKEIRTDRMVRQSNVLMAQARAAIKARDAAAAALEAQAPLAALPASSRPVLEQPQWAVMPPLPPQLAVIVDSQDRAQMALPRGDIRPQRPRSARERRL